MGPQVVGARSSTSEPVTVAVATPNKVDTRIAPKFRRQQSHSFATAKRPDRIRIGHQIANTFPLGEKLRSVVYRHPALASVTCWIFIPPVFGILIGSSLEGIYERPQYTGIGFVLTMLVVAIAWLNRTTLLSAIQQIPDRIRKIDGNWIFVAAAVGLRFALLQIVPPDFPGFEEMQQGKIAHDIVHNEADLSFHFLFSNVLSTIGFAFSGNDLDDLRFGYELAGAASIVLLAICLRRLKVEWDATLVAVFIFASLRWAVIIGGLAEESFGPSMLLMLLILLIVMAETSTRNQYFWAGLGGIAAGMLMYEYTPFVFFLSIPPIYWIISTRIGRRFAVRRDTFVKSLWLVVAMSVVAAPLVAQLIFEPEITHVGDAFLRHNVYETSAETGILGDVDKMQQHFTSYMRTIFGIKSDMSSLYFRTIDGSVVPLVVGLIFIAAVLSALNKPKQLLPFILAISVPAFLILISATSLSYYEARLTPLVPILMLLSGLALNQAIPFVKKRRLIDARYVPIAIAVGTIAIVSINFVGSARLSIDEKSLIEYTNNKYTVCRAVAEQPYVFDQLLVIGFFGCGFGDEIWLYPDRNFATERTDDIPYSSEISTGTLVVAGNNHGLSVNTYDDVRQLAIELGSDDTTLEFATLLNRTAAFTFCYRCQPQVE